MRTLFLIAILAPVLSHPQSLQIPGSEWSRCDEYRAITEHKSTALERVSDCLAHGTSGEKVGCTADVLAQLED